MVGRAELLLPAHDLQLLTRQEHHTPLLVQALQPLGWRVEEGEVWAQATPPGVTLPAQGWKLHLTAVAARAPDLLAGVLPVLTAHDVTFKVAVDGRTLSRLNEGMAGLTQVGKFLTAYPVDDDAAVALAADLHRAGEGFRGPWIPSDRPLRPGSIVHYRYGTFRTADVTGADGVAATMLQTPDGPVPDRRSEVYLPLPWLRDPFLAAGVATPLPEPSGVLDGRYVIVDTLHRTPRGAIQIAVDATARRTVLLKRAHRLASIGPDGRDAVDRLHDEAALLGDLAGHPGFPQVGPVLVDGEDRLLVMEDLGADDLQGRLVRRRHLAAPVDPAEALGTVADIADLLGVMHDRGLLHRDCKPANVLYREDGQPVLIDHEMAGPPGATDTAGTRGTLGYVPPERRDMPVGHPRQDVYALGVVLHELLTLEAPWDRPDSYRLRDSRPEHVVPGLPTAVVEVRDRLLGPAEERPADGAEAARLLRAVGAHLDGTAGPTTPPQLDPADALAAAGDVLGAITAGVRDAAPYRRPATLYDGDAGIVLLGSVALAAGLDVDTDGLVALTDRLAARELVVSPDAVGALWTGQLGVAVALDHAGEALDRPALREAADGIARTVARLPLDNPDLLAGAAGRAMGHLLLHERTGDPAQLDAAVVAAAHLAARVDTSGREDRNGDPVAWVLPRQEGSLSGGTFRGYAHGTAGIADALLAVGHAAAEDGLTILGLRAVEGLLGAASPALADGSGLTWTEPQRRGGHQGILWCYGATGVATTLRRAARVTADRPDLMERGHVAASDHATVAGAHRRALAAAAAARHLGPGRCHGLAGAIGVLAHHGEAVAARHLGFLLRRSLVPADGGMLPAVADATLHPGLMTGAGGVAMALLHLAGVLPRDPLTVPVQAAGGTA